MGKGSIARILLWETAITYGLTTGTGLLLGMVLYKLAELGMVRLFAGARDLYADGVR